jgi:hypothetical protein
VNGFIIGVLSSLAATTVTVVAGWLTSRQIRRWLVLMLSRLTGLGIKRYYRRQRDANVDLHKDLNRARWVKVLAGRGNELTRDSFQEVWRSAGARIERVEILLPDPNTGADSWLSDREAEMRRFDPGIRAGLLAEQVQANIRYLTSVATANDHVRLQVYDLPNLGRIIVTDRVAYLTTYTADEHGRNSPCFVFTSPSPMYDFALRMFTTAWDRARLASKHEIGQEGPETMDR